MLISLAFQIISQTSFAMLFSMATASLQSKPCSTTNVKQQPYHKAISYKALEADLGKFPSCVCLVSIDGSHVSAKATCGSHYLRSEIK